MNYFFVVYRFFTYAVAHPNLIEFAVSIAIMVPTSKEIERQLGTVVFVSSSLLFTLLQGLLVSIFLAAKASLTGTPEDFFAADIHGFSGVLLSLCVIHANKFVESEGFRLLSITVPMPLYPWCLLVAFTFIPGVSLPSLVTGMALGYAYVFGWLSCIFPSKNFGLRVEARQLRDFVSGNGFVPATPPLTMSPLSSPLTTQPASPAPVSRPLLVCHQLCNL